MSALQEIFNNREIAIGSWVIITIIISVFTKPVKQFLKSVIPILFCRKFFVFYVVFLMHLGGAIYLLHVVGFWSASMLKDTIFWVMFVELPLFVKTIEKAKDSHFFATLIKENIAFIIIIEFVINFWTFDLLIEIILVPIALFFGLIYALAAKKQEHLKVKKFFDWLLMAFGFVAIINVGIHIFQTPTELFDINTLKYLLLPIILLLLNIPIIYGLALHNT